MSEWNGPAYVRGHRVLGASSSLAGGPEGEQR
jgi:hypothetical protein